MFFAQLGSLITAFDNRCYKQFTRGHGSPLSLLHDEVHALLLCRNVGLCAFRCKYAYLFSQFAGDFSVERPYLTQPVRAQAVSNFLLQ